MIPLTNYGVKWYGVYNHCYNLLYIGINYKLVFSMSMGFLVEENSAIVWRGLMV